MTFTLSVGALLAAAAVFMKYTGRLTWPQLLITFAAGVMLSGSAVGLMTRRAAEGTAQIVQTGITAGQDAAANAGRTPPRATPSRRPPARTTGARP